MQPRIDLITLGVPDLEEARRFYVEGLGWAPLLEVAGEVSFIQTGHSRVLALWGAEELAEDARGGPPPSAPRGAGVAFAQNVGSAAEVDAVIADAQAAGAAVVKPPQDTEWGGYHGYFADPAGFLWEVAHNPTFRIEADGRVRMGADG